MEKEKIMRKILMALLGALLVPTALLASPAMGADAESASSSGEDNPCLVAPDQRTYTVCFALWNQPSYDWTQPDGTIIGEPTGSELMAELSEEDITPDGTPWQFRRAAQAEIEGYLKHVQR